MPFASPTAASPTSASPPTSTSRAWRSARDALLVVLITVVASSCFVAIRNVAGFSPPLRFAALRLALAAAALLPLLPLTRQPLLPPRRYWPALAMLALAATALGYGAVFASPALAGAGLASVLGNTQPLLVLAAGPWLLRERLTARTLLALTIGLTGILLVTLPLLAGPDGLRFGRGALLALTSSAGLAIGTIVVKRLPRDAPVLTLTAWQLLLGAAPLALASGALEAGIPTVWSTSFVVTLLYLAVAGTTFITVAWYQLLARHEAGRLSLAFFLVPAFGLALAALFLGETTAPVQIAGVALIVASTLGSALHPAAPGTQTPRPTRRNLPQLQQGDAMHDADRPSHSFIDPVCGMTVDPATSDLRSEYRGKTYTFCSPACKDTFDADPAAYVGHGSEHDGHDHYSPHH